MHTNAHPQMRAQHLHDASMIEILIHSVYQATRFNGLMMAEVSSNIGLSKPTRLGFI